MPAFFIADRPSLLALQNPLCKDLLPIAPQKTNLRWFLFFSVILLIVSCGKENRTKPCKYIRYSFNITSTFTPEHKVYMVGDTIYLSSIFPKINTDQISNSQIDYSNAKAIGGNMSFFEFDTIKNSAVPALNRFKVFAIKGSIEATINHTDRVTDVIYADSGHDYQFNCGIILKEKGIYAIFVTDLLCQGIPGQDCTNAGFTNTVSNPNQNLDLFLNVLNPPIGQYEGMRSFCFRVQ